LYAFIFIVFFSCRRLQSDSDPAYGPLHHGHSGHFIAVADPWPRQRRSPAAGDIQQLASDKLVSTSSPHAIASSFLSFGGKGKFPIQE
jgi:hypothetical protein